MKRSEGTKVVFLQLFYNSQHQAKRGLGFTLEQLLGMNTVIIDSMIMHAQLRKVCGGEVDSYAFSFLSLSLNTTYFKRVVSTTQH